MQRNLIIGLDIGITSVGWGVINKETMQVVASGVRLFPEGANDENLKRRTRRGVRRLKRRQKQRLSDMRDLLKNLDIIDENFVFEANPYELRCRGLVSRLSNSELATSILHITKHRGTSFETVEEDETNKDELSNELVNQQLSIATNKHICEIQLERFRTKGFIRGNENIFKTDQYVKETKAILKNQDLTEEDSNKIIEIIQRRRQYYEGPGSKKSPTKYGRFYYDETNNLVEVDLIEKMRGKCSLYPEQLRAPATSSSAELYNLFNDMNNIKWNGSNQLTTDDKINLVNKYILEKGKFTLNELAKYLECNIAVITGFRIDKSGNALFTEFKGYNKLRLALGKDNPVFQQIKEDIKKLNFDQPTLLDEIAETLTKKKGIDERKTALKHILTNASNDEIDIIANLSGFTKYHAFSFKALRELNKELLQTNLNQMQIVTNQKKNNPLEKYKTGLKITFNEEEILSPIAKRAHREAIKVLNELSDDYGTSIDSIIIESAREKNSAEVRQNEVKRQKAREINNKTIEDSFSKVDAKGRQLTPYIKQKLQLYVSQDGRCIYSGNPIDLNLLINDSTYCEVDHILPFSISLDDSLNNKVLCENRANQMKGQTSPFMYFKSGKAYGFNYEMFKSYVLSLYTRKLISYKKKNNLLYEEDLYKFEARLGFINRNLVDTRYANRSIMNTIQNHYKNTKQPIKVFSVRGSITDLFRKKAGIEKDRTEFKHHAIDALIIAGIKSQNFFSELLQLSKDEVIDQKTGEIVSKSSESAINSDFIRYVKHLNNLQEFQDIKFSYKVDKKPNRKVSDETIYSTRLINEKHYVVKKYNDIYDEKAGEVVANKIKEANGAEQKLLVYKNDPQTYILLKTIVESYPNERNPFLAYKNDHGDIRKYSKKGNGPIITSLKYIEDELNVHIDISKNYRVTDKKVVLLQLSPYRTDFYYSEKYQMYKFVTVRYAMIRQSKEGYYIEKEKYNDLRESKGISNDYDYLFSLHRNEFVRISTIAAEGEMMRFIGTNNDNRNTIECKYISQNAAPGKQIMITIGKKTKKIDKFHVSPTGKLIKVDKEVLQLNLNMV